MLNCHVTPASGNRLFYSIPLQNNGKNTSPEDLDPPPDFTLWNLNLGQKNSSDDPLKWELHESSPDLIVKTKTPEENRYIEIVWAKTRRITYLIQKNEIDVDEKKNGQDSGYVARPNDPLYYERLVEMIGLLQTAASSYEKINLETSKKLSVTVKFLEKKLERLKKQVS